MPRYRRIKDLREDSDKTQTEVAEYLGTTAQYYGKYEKGEREIPFTRAIKLADYYGVSLDYLSGRADSQKIHSYGALTDDEKKMHERYHALSERNKGKVEQFVDNLYEESKAKSEQHGQNR